MRSVQLQARVLRSVPLRWLLAGLIGLGVMFQSQPEAGAAGIAFVQGNYAVPQTPQATVTVPFTSAQQVGSLNVVIVGWNDTTASVLSVTDTNQNIYTRAIGPTVSSNALSQSIYYAKNVPAAAAGANVVTVTFSGPANFPDIRILEYSGIDPVTPVDVTTGRSGNSATSSTVAVTTTSASSLIVGANTVQSYTSGPGANFTSRMITSPDGDIAEDRIVSTVGSYSASAPLVFGGRWVMQMVAFRAIPVGATPIPTATATQIPTATPTLNGTITATSTPAPVVGLKAAYAFDETGGLTATDASGNGVTGTLVNGPVFSAGHAGNALTFDGSNDYVSLGTPAALQNTGSMTVSAWVKSTTFPGDDAAIVSKRASSGFQLDTTIDRGPRTIGFKLTNSTGGDMFRYGATTLQTGTWYHLAGVYDAAAQTLNVYLNGQPDNGALVGTITASQANPNNAVLIGQRSSSGFRFNGQLDDVRIYSRALSLAEIQADMATPVGTTATATPTLASTATATRTSTPSSTATNTAAATSTPTLAPTNTATPTTAASATATSTPSQTSLPSATPTTVIVATATSSLTPTNTATALPTSTVTSTPTQSATATSTLEPTATATLEPTPTATATVIGGATATSTPAPVVGLGAAYAFDEISGLSATDASGHGATGTLVNNPTWSAGHAGNALTFDGSNDYVSLGNPASLQIAGSMTVSAWVKSTAFPGDDAAIVSKRGAEGFQFDTTVDRGPRTIGFKLTNSSGSDMFRYGASTLQTGTWYHLAGVYNAGSRTLDVYLNGQLDNGALVGTVTSTQEDTTNAVLIGQRSSGGFQFNGQLDDVRIYTRALSQAEIQSDMAAPVGGGSGNGDTVPPTVSVTAPQANAQVTDIITLSATASDNLGVAGVQFLVDGANAVTEIISAPYTQSWDSRSVSNGTHSVQARARDAAGNVSLSTPVSITVSNTSQFQNEILSTGFALPTAIRFLPDGRLLVVELEGKIKILPPPYTQPDATPFLQLTNVGSAGVQQGVYDIILDPQFDTNRFYYIFYTAGSPNRDRVSRFTANSTLTGTVAGSELVLYQDGQDAHAEHHGGALVFGNDGKLYFTTGEHFDASVAQSLSSPRGKVHRINKDGTVPNDNPFFDGSGPNVDSIWAYGLRNPFRASYDAPTGRYFIGDVGGNTYSTAQEEIELGVRGANYGWPNVEGSCSAPCTAPLYSYPHNGRDAAVVGGFVYRGSQYPSSYVGSYFFADYTQNWIRRLTFDGNGNVNGVFNFEPPNSSLDGPYGDIVYLTEGPDGAIYYVDLGYSDIEFEFGLSKVRRIRYIQGNAPPTVAASASPTSGTVPLTVAFSSAGTSDPEGQTLSYSWVFGDGGTSTAANPSHTYTQAGQYTARLTVSDGSSSSQSSPMIIQAGAPPTVTITSPVDNSFFIAGDSIAFDANAIDPDGTLPASAYSWNIDFLHAGHVHPGIPIVGAKSGTYSIPTTGHDFSGDTRFRFTVTVTDSSGLTTSESVLIYPRKVNLSFNSAPSGLQLYLDGIARTAPFVYDTLIGFTHTIQAPNQTQGATNYTFTSWSDSGAQQHSVVVPSTDQSYVATFAAVQPTVGPTAGPITFRQVNATTPQSPQQSVPVAFSQAQTAGNTNVLAIGWNDAVANITSVADSAGNAYSIAAPLFRQNGLSQAIYISPEITAAGPGSNTVTVSFDRPAAYVDVRILEYAGLAQTNTVDVTASAGGSAATASSGNVTTTSANELIFGAGMTTGVFSAAGSGFTLRIITQPDADIAEDRIVSATGTYAATASSSGVWIMQVVTLRAGP